ncbi:cellulose biosynthesis cyclic di-GMP-binding regulatory protein BcsB [Paenarthrobacter nitroguajacolicus]|uniref:Cellulose biosynthesis cyclic di-GMP-binding regulatory protein BcsB n=1 Tax=Paenarthrobacter nitroguajacolicus TaxID=211146 RepID=A0A558H0S9_PAENT|nr:cellulose biosynthesis cyclic di-GMP-binding regulatory protein BcsB [Paenarthrobacter nitroguajacolicus]TVU62739.1 cellulose biosynthesis cyclic di-GMP-binding regulatory protein BcsB [Paenarthrobacter nitroguajacolicus]
MTQTPARPRARSHAGAIILACAATLALSAVTAPGAIAAPPEGAALRTSSSVSALAGQNEQTLVVPVTAGLEPTRVKGTIVVSGKPEGTVRATVNGRVVLETKAAASIPLDAAVSAADMTAADVAGQQLTVGLQFVAATQTMCVVSNATATLNNLAVDFSGTAKVPTTVGEFFPASVPAVVLPVPAEPGADVSAAIMTASAAMSHRYPDAAVSVVPDTELAARAANLPAGSRVLSVVADQGETSTELATAAGLPQLILSGHDDQLRTAARALSSDKTALAVTSSVTGLTSALPAAPGLVQSLKDLGSSTLKLSGYGTPESYVGVTQSQFGGPVSSVKVQLKGTHTAVPDNAQAQVSVFWNDYLLSSKNLDGGDTFTVDADVPAGQLQAKNGLRIRLAALPAGGDCTGPAGVMPMEVTVDTAGSNLTAVRGGSTKAGFARFPQTFGQSVPVAFGPGNAQANTVNAASLVASLQRDSATLLDTRMVGLDDLAGSSESGLVVGATADAANRLSAPLRLAEFRTIAPADVEYGVGTTAPFGVLEAFEQGGRDLLLLGAWAPEGDTAGASTLQASLASHVSGVEGGWASLSRNLLVTQPSGTPVLLESNVVVPQKAVTDDYRPYAWWIGGAVLILGLAFALRTVLMRRRAKAAQDYVDAEQKATEPGHGN